MLKVTTQGGETKELEFRQGMKVEDALKSAGMEATKRATISVNGRSAGNRTQLNDSDIVVVTPKVKNG